MPCVVLRGIRCVARESREQVEEVVPSAAMQHGCFSAICHGHRSVGKISSPCLFLESVTPQLLVFVVTSISMWVTGKRI